MFAVTHHKQIVAHKYAYELLAESVPAHLELDHACRNRLCVRPHEKHVRLVTTKQNAENKGIAANNKSGVRGVYWNSERRRWQATVTHNRKAIYVGRYQDLAEAAEAVRLRRLELFTHNEEDRHAEEAPDGE